MYNLRLRHRRPTDVLAVLTAMFDRIFEALFSYSPFVFQQGDFRFDLTAGVARRDAVGRCGRGRAVLTYRRVRVNEGRVARPRRPDHPARVLALAVVLFCLFRPTLVVRAAVNQQNVVAVLLDDSRSMQIPDQDGKPRGEFVRDAVRPGRGAAKSLSDRFLVRVFRFSSDGRAPRLGRGADGSTARRPSSARR